MSSSVNVPCSKIEYWSNNELVMWSCIEKYNDILEVRLCVIAFHVVMPMPTSIGGLTYVDTCVCIYVWVYH
jgi:hypothetical protein